MGTKQTLEYIRILRAIAQNESDTIMPQFRDMVKGGLVTIGLWVAYLIAFVPAPFTVTWDVVLVMIGCVLCGYATTQYLTHRRIQKRIRLYASDDLGVGYNVRNWRKT